MSSSRALLALVFVLAVLTACSGGPGPVATDEALPGSSADDESFGDVATELAFRNLDANRAPLEFDTPIASADGPGSMARLTDFPFAPAPDLPVIEDAFLACDENGVAPWVQLADGTGGDAGEETVRQQISIHVPDGPVDLIYVADAITAVGPLAEIDAWKAFPGNPADRSDLLAALCTASAWPMTVEVTAADGAVLKAALNVLVRDSGWTHTHGDLIPAMGPDADTKTLELPWIDPLTGLTVAAIDIECLGPDAGVAAGMTLLGPDLNLVGVQQWMSFVGASPVDGRVETEPVRYTTAAAQQPEGAETESDFWLTPPGSPVNEPLDYDIICGTPTWEVFISVSNGAGGVLEGLVEATVTGGRTPSGASELAESSASGE